MSNTIRNIVKFIVLLFIQVILLKNLDLGFGNWWLTPFIFILFVLELPVRINQSLLLLIAFGLGLFLDVFYDTLGLHASASLFAAFIRIYILKTVVPKEGFDPYGSPGIQTLGFIKYTFYISIVLFSYHLWFFILEAFSFSSLLLRLSQSLLSTIVAIGIALLIQYIFIVKKK